MRWLCLVMRTIPSSSSRNEMGVLHSHKLLRLKPRNETFFKFEKSTHARTHFIQQQADANIHSVTSLQCGAMLQSLTNAKSFKQGQQLHGHIIVCGTLRSNTYLSTKLAAFYASCGVMTQARLIFDGIASKSSFLWNFMIRGYACNGLALNSLVLYREMMSSSQKADNFTYPFVIKACGELLLVDIGRGVHGEVVVNGFESDVYVGNSILAMYLQFGDIRLARTVFDRMLERDLSSWNTMISGYVRNGDAREAFAVFDSMGKARVFVDGTTLLGLLSACGELEAVKQGREIHGYFVRNSFRIHNNFLTNSLIQMYCDCNSMIDARKLFEVVQLKDTVSWNTMISGYARNNDAFESLRLFCQMILEREPDEVTVVAVLGASDQITALQFGMSVHSYLVKKGFNDNSIVGTALLDMYSKSGSLACSRRAFDEMPNKNLFSWSAMVSGYGAHGMGRQAISLFHEMIATNITPDEGVITSVLSACSHAGLVAEGKEIFHTMAKDYNIEPRLAHYSCLVDLLGRAGQLDEAYKLIKSMKVNPTSDIWGALLSACRLHRNVELAEIVAQEVFDTNPKGVGRYICLSNIYAAAKRWDDVERVRAMVRRKGFKKPPGCCFVELDRKVHRFLVGDRSHEQTKDIYAKLEDLKQQLKEAGYKPDTSSVSYDVEEVVKENMLWDHSERLAVAFALLNTGPGTIIRITKNLRVCGDCHTVIKLVSKLMCREIIMRDIHRFHHFRDGFCSCGDYW